MGIKKKVKEDYKLSFWIGVLSLILVGNILILVTQLTDNELLISLLNNISSALIITGVFGLINEFLLKEKLVGLILNKLKLKENIEKTGINEVFLNVRDIDYRYLLKNSNRKIDICHIYGRTWTNYNSDSLRERLLHSNCEIRVILLSPESDFVKGLAELYGREEDELRKTMYEVQSIWRTLYHEKKKVKKKRTQSSIRVYISNSFPAHSIYRFDDKILQVQSKLTKGKSSNLPSILCENTHKTDELYNVYLNEIEKIIMESEELDLDSEKEKQTG
ncbi:hypothetical protein [Halobacillus kuroshimensis]|uniref:hypothetical protein n=1 Tax=Halobacillus kuroshimensis TaxID=302481 RepID=UPI000409F38E|nr:hypothetical protein [Halobacillus kuroshimensis]